MIDDRFLTDGITCEDIHFYVVCPVFNCAFYINRAIDSVLKQDYYKWDLILVDDGSTDNSLKICRGYSILDRRIHVVSQNNKGPYYARETGLKYILNCLKLTGYVLFLDSDDFYVPSCLSTLNQIILASKKSKMIDFVCFNSEWVSESGVDIDPVYRISYDVFLTGSYDILLECIFNGLKSYIWSYCIKTELLLNNLFTPNELKKRKLCEDLFMLLFVLLASKSGILTQQTLYVHVNNVYGITSNNNLEDYFDYLFSINYVLEKCISVYPLLENSISNNMINDHVFIAYKSLLFIASNNNYFFFKKNVARANKLLIFKVNEKKSIIYKSKNIRLFLYMMKKNHFLLMYYFFRVYKNFKFLKRSIKRSKSKKTIKTKYIDNTVSIFCNNCISGKIYKNSNQIISSPTTWCLIEPADLIKLGNNLSHYLNMKLLKSDTPFDEEYKHLGGHFALFPCAYLGDIKIMFPHYKTYEEALEKWERRVKRICYDNIYFIVFLEKDFKASDYYNDFARIPYKKIMIGYDTLDCEDYYQLKSNKKWYEEDLEIPLWESFDWKSFFE